MTDSRDRENGGPKMDRRGALECKRLGGNRLLCGSRVGRADNLGFIPRADPHAFAAVMPLDNPGGEDRLSSMGLSWSHILITLLMFAIPCVSLKPRISPSHKMRRMLRTLSQPRSGARALAAMSQ